MYLNKKNWSFGKTLKVSRIILFFMSLMTLNYQKQGYVTWKVWGGIKNVPMYLCLKFQSSGMNERVSRTLLSFMASFLWLSWTLKVPDWGCITWKVCGWLKKVSMYLDFKFQPFGNTKMVSRTLLSLMSSLLGLWRTLEVPGSGFIPWKLRGWLNEVPM